MSIEIENTASFLKNVETQIVARTGLTIRGPNSKVGALANIFSEELAKQSATLQGVVDSLQYTTAKGVDLDRLAQQVGMERFIPLFANSKSDERNFAFYVDSGTFGDINSGSDIAVLAGTLIQSNIQQNDQGQVISYKLLEDVICDSADSIVYFSAQAVLSGTSSNVGEFVIRNHSLPYSGLKVVNFYPILNGRDEETDSQLRFRITNKLTATISVNKTTNDLNSLSIPGVLETRLVGNMFGTGTTGLVVLGSEFKTNSKLLRLVQDRVNTIAPVGAKIIATPAFKASFTIKILLIKNQLVTSTFQENISNRIRIGIKNYLRGVGLGGEVSKRNIYEIVKRNLTTELSIGNIEESLLDIKVNRSNPYKISTLDASSFRLEDTEYADLEVLDVIYGD